MAQDTGAMFYLCDLFREFSKPHQLVHVEEFSGANLNPLMVYPLLCDYNDGMQKQHSPNYELRHDYAELRDQLKLQVRHSKRSVHRHEQKLHDVKVELSGDKEFEQTYLNLSLIHI